MRRLMFLAVLAAVAASMWGILADGGRKAEAQAGPETITAIATFGGGPPGYEITPCPTGGLIEGDFTISPNVVPGCGDGVDEFTAWTFDFGSRFNAPFNGCLNGGGQLTSAKLTLELEPRSNLITTDSVGMREPLFPKLPVELSVSSPMMNDKIRALPNNGDIYTLTQEFLTDPGVLNFGDILKMYNNSLPTGRAKISMIYQEDAILHSAQLQLTCGGQAVATGDYCIYGTSTGIGWYWTITTATKGSLINKQVQDYDVAVGDDASALANAWVGSINDVINNPTQQVTASTSVGNQSHCFKFTPANEVKTLEVRTDGKPWCTVTGNQSGCEFNPTVIEVLEESAVGGTTELLTDGSAGPGSDGGGSGSSEVSYAALAGGMAAGVLALAAGGWYVRRRFRQRADLTRMR